MTTGKTSFIIYQTFQDTIVHQRYKIKMNHEESRLVRSVVYLQPIGVFIMVTVPRSFTWVIMFGLN